MHDDIDDDDDDDDDNYDDYDDYDDDDDDSDDIDDDNDVGNIDFQLSLYVLSSLQSDIYISYYRPLSFCCFHNISISLLQPPQLQSLLLLLSILSLFYYRSTSKDIRTKSDILQTF